MKRPFILTMIIFLLMASSVRTVHCQEKISRGQLVSDSLAPNSSKLYELSEQFEKGCCFSIQVKIHEGSYGTAILQKETETVYSWTIMQSLGTTYLPPFYYTATITRGGSYALNVTNSHWSERLNYTFYYDVSSQLQAENTKTIPLEGGIACFHIDLETGDKVFLNLTSPEGSDFDMQVFFGYTYLMLSPNIASSTSTEPSETLTFKAENNGRYFIFVTSTSGNGTFTLKSTITKAPPEEPKVDYDALINEINNLKMATYALTFTTLIILAVVLYLAARRPKPKTEPPQ